MLKSIGYAAGYVTDAVKDERKWQYEHVQKLMKSKN